MYAAQCPLSVCHECVKRGWNYHALEIIAFNFASRSRTGHCVPLLRFTRNHDGYTLGTGLHALRVVWDKKTETWKVA